MTSTKTLHVLCQVIHHGEHYLRRGDPVPASVPAEIVEGWLKAGRVGEAKSAPEKSGRKT